MPPETEAPRRRWLIEIPVLALVYLIMGWLGTRLAIAPAYVTAIFPPAGVALACLYLGGNRLWPGVLLGSTSLSLVLGWLGLADTPWGTLGLSLALGSSSTLQALVGATMLRRAIGPSSSLDDGRSILRFLLVAAGSCTIAPALAVALLVATGKITNPLLTSFTWWSGDTLGVVLFTPIAFCALARPRELWRRRFLTVAAPMGLVLAVTGALFLIVSKLDRNAAQLTFERRVDSLALRFESELKRGSQAVHEISGLFAASHRVDRDEFIAFANRLKLDWERVQAVEWIPRVRGTERSAFEQQVQAAGWPEFTLKRWTDSGWSRQDSGWAEEYFPVDYVHPMVGNEPAFGIDLGSHPARRKALEVARDTGQSMATGWIRLAQAEDDETGVLILHPIYAGGSTPSTLQARRDQLLGYSLVVLRISSLLRSVVGDTSDLNLSIVDESAAQEGRLDLRSAPEIDSPLRWSSRLQVGQRTWRLEFASKRPALGRSWLPWALFAGGLLSCGLVGSFLLFISGHHTQVHREVARRTAELTRVNQELANSNKDLDGFAYVASHDLKAPLRAIRHLAEWIDEDSGDQLDEQSRKNLGTMRARVDRMNALLDDLLAYSRAGRDGRDNPEPIQVGVVVANVVSLLAPPDGIQVTLVSGHDLRVRTVRTPLELVLRNLIGNAIKHHDRSEGRIEIEVLLPADGLMVEVRDDGPGIRAQHHERIFEMFTTLRPRDEVEGSGMGLAIVKRTIDRQGGSLTIESGPERGTTFRFFWPGTPLPAAPQGAQPSPPIEVQA